jgi:hypothetical protein
MMVCHLTVISQIKISTLYQYTRKAQRFALSSLINKAIFHLSILHKDQIKQYFIYQFYIKIKCDTINYQH